MNCKEFELLGLDSCRDVSLGEDVRQRALQHVRHCARCTGLSASWKEARTELMALEGSTQGLVAPSRVEIRLLQQFRLKHQSRQGLRTLKFATWSLAAAAILLGMAGVREWHKWREGTGTNRTESDRSAVAQSSSRALALSDGGGVTETDASEILIADNDGIDFMQFPGSSAEETEDGAIVRVGMQRAALGALGLPVNEEHAGDWIQVDLLVASDGSPQAVRLPR